MASMLFLGLDMPSAAIALGRSDRLDEIDYRDIRNVLGYIMMLMPRPLQTSKGAGRRRVRIMWSRRCGSF